MILVGIPELGMPDVKFHAWTEHLDAVIEQTHNLYKVRGYNPPWIGYIAIDDGHAIGTCAFKAPPAEGRVEISYYTFPEYEGKGIATMMAEMLLDIARCECPKVVLTAQTLPEKNPSTRILEKLGFEMIHEIDHPEDGRVWEWHLPNVDTGRKDG